MKKILVLLLIISAQATLAQNLIIPKKVLQAKHPLTTQDRKNYFLKINQQLIRKPHTISTDSGKFKIVDIHIKLTNRYPDTLKYFEFTCSWNWNYRTDNRLVEIEDWPCESNYPILVSVPPNHTLVKSIPVMIRDNIKGSIKFKIGMYLNRYFDGDAVEATELFYFESNRDQYKNILIWSDEVSMQL